MTPISEKPNARDMSMVSTLRAWRLGEGFSIEAVAEQIGISPSFLTEIELGASCSLRVAARIEVITGGMVRAIHLSADHERLGSRQRPSPSTEQFAA